MAAATEMAAERVAALLAPWRERRPDATQAEAFYRALNATRANVYVFVIADGIVATLDKPDDLRGDDSVRAGWRWRAGVYRMFLQDAVEAGRLQAPTILAMSMDDYSLETHPFPMFAFQRRIGREELLLPDLDALNENFYAGFADARSYDDKIDRAVFIGSTTGAIHTVASVAALSCPRLRSGVFFRDREEVDFRLPTIVQCVDAAAEAAIRALGFGTGAAGWSEQLRNRFVLSMDGNGATCSRPAKVLASNSVLVKYASDFELHYSGWLQPRRDFVPVAVDADVLRVIARAAAEPERFRLVAKAGTRFFHTFLSREACTDYTVQLLRSYCDCFNAAVARPAGHGAAQPLAEAAAVAEPVRLGALVHISGRGDCVVEPLGEAGTAGSGLAIEGFAIEVKAGLRTPELAYRALYASEADEPWRPAGSFAGTRSQARPLLGIEVRLEAAAAARWQLALQAGFLDGSTAGGVGSEVACRAASGAALECFSLELVARAERPVAGTLRLGVLNADPLVVLCAIAVGTEAMDVAAQVAARVQRRFGLILLLAPGVAIGVVAGWVQAFGRADPYSRIWIACDRETQLAAMAAARLQGELLPLTAFVDETLFRPAAAQRQFDAIYAAAMDDASQHELAALINRVCIAYDAEADGSAAAEAAATLDEVRRLMPQAAFVASPTASARAQLMQASGVGLLLTAGQEDAPMALQYALCGLPIVCAADGQAEDTAEWVIGCDAAPTSVAAAVQRGVRQPADRQSIRRAAMQQLAEDRTLWRQAVRRLCAQLGNRAGDLLGAGFATFRAVDPCPLRSADELPRATGDQ